MIKELGINGFRNLSRTEAIELPSEGVMVAAAPNAAGKTNFLESIAVLLRGRSWRGKLEECVGWGKDGMTLWGKVEDFKGEERRVAVQYYKPTKTLKIEEGGEPASIVTYYSRYPLVVFLPEDTYFLSRGPAVRRNFLNQVLAAQPAYLSALVQYQRALKQRNKFLKSSRSFSEIRGWTEILAEQAEVIWKHRRNLVEYLDMHLSEEYLKSTGENRVFGVKLFKGVDKEGDYLQALAGVYQQEKIFGHTVMGPHRDDMTVLTDDKMAAAVLSRGQTCGLVITLKMLVHRYLKHATKETPVLLLDDVLSELDEQRQRILLDNLPAGQIFMTTTKVPDSLRGKAKVYLLDLESVVDSVYQEKAARESGEGEANKEASKIPGDDFAKGDEVEGSAQEWEESRVAMKS